MSTLSQYQLVYSTAQMSNVWKILNSQATKRTIILDTRWLSWLPRWI